jgi:hypothetical protein
MRAFLIAAALASVLFCGTTCPAQAVNPATIDTQSVSDSAPSGVTCAFQERTGGIEDYPNCILQDGSGKLFIAQEYVRKMRFNSFGLAAVFDYDPSRQEFLYVDRKRRVVIEGVQNFDNWTDEFSDGLVRIVVDKKHGFADPKGRIVIAPKYDGAGPFEHGYAIVCMGCRETCIMPSDAMAHSENDCEHRTVTGGAWLKINKAGRVVARVPDGARVPDDFWAQSRPTYNIDKPTILAFFAPVNQAQSKDVAADETRADFQFYGQQVRKPLATMGVDYKEIYMPGFVVRVGHVTMTFRPANGVGYYFVAPDKKPHVKYGVMTDSDLLQAAHNYFGANGKQQQ